MPISSSAPKLAEMKARPVTHMGIERAEVRKSAKVFMYLAQRPADADHNDGVGEEDG